MSFTSAASSAMPRLPVTWKEFSELLQSNHRSAKNATPDRVVERVNETKFQTVASGTNDRAADEHLFGRKLGSWSATYETEPKELETTENPCDSPPCQDEYRSFEAFA